MTIITCDGYADEKTCLVDGWNIAAFLPTKGLRDPWKFKYLPEISDGEIGFIAKAYAGKRFGRRIFEVELLVDRKIYEQDDALVSMIWGWAVSKLFSFQHHNQNQARTVSVSITDNAGNTQGGF